MQFGSYIKNNLLLSWLLIKKPEQYWPAAFAESERIKKLYLQFLLPLLIPSAIFLFCDSCIHYEPLAGLRQAMVYVLLQVMEVFIAAKLLKAILPSANEKALHVLIIFTNVPGIVSGAIHDLLAMSAAFLLNIFALPLWLAGLILMIVLYFSGIKNFPAEAGEIRRGKFIGFAAVLGVYMLFDTLADYLDNYFFHFVR